jgi:hypothetical protein
VLLDLFAVHLFFVLSFESLIATIRRIADQEEDPQDQEDRDYESELGDDYSGATTHPPRRSY